MNAENHLTLDATAIVSFYTEMSKMHLIFMKFVPSKCSYVTGFEITRLPRTIINI